MWSDRLRRFLCALLCALCVGVVPAHAATIVGDTGGLVAADVVDTTGTLTLTLDPGNPHDDPPPGPVAGVEFTA
ncbi:hypothetical protein, partial [Corynebacterium nasicanis]